MREAYLNMIALVERLHRQFLELVRVELDALGVLDINNVQALILFNIGTSEFTVGELTLRGCYLGSNVSYNVKKMVEADYLVLERSTHDRRSVRVRLSQKGLDLCTKLDAMHDRLTKALSETPIDQPALDQTNVTLRRLDRFWTHNVDLATRIMPRVTPAA
jgi:DNA-binding MarR family transcriptional regulator